MKNICALGLASIGFYAIYRWKKADDKTQMLMGYLKAHVQYHKDNGIPFGP